MGWGFWEASGTYPAKPDPSSPRGKTRYKYFVPITVILAKVSICLPMRTHVKEEQHVKLNFQAHLRNISVAILETTNLNYSRDSSLVERFTNTSRIFGDNLGKVMRGAWRNFLFLWIVSKFKIIFWNWYLINDRQLVCYTRSITCSLREVFVTFC